MNSISAFQSGLQGIQRGLNELNRHAADIASAKQFSPQTAADTDLTTDLTTSLIGLKQSELQVAISTKVIEAADNTIGTLLDISA